MGFSGLYIASNTLKKCQNASECPFWNHLGINKNHGFLKIANAKVITYQGTSLSNVLLMKIFSITIKYVELKLELTDI